MAFFIPMKITQQQNKDSLIYAVAAVEAGAYARLGETKEQQIERWHIGKLGEIVFYNLLTDYGIKVEYTDMFKFIGVPDEYDFIMPKGRYKIDVKTYKPRHRYLLLPKGQTKNISQIDIYVGVVVDVENLKGFVDGYVWKDTFIQESNEKVSKSMPEPCYNREIKDLIKIDQVLKFWYF